LFSLPPIIILQSFNIILAKIFTELYFYKNHVTVSVIPDPVDVALSDIHRLSRSQFQLFIVAGHQGPAAYHKPMLTPVFMPLQ